MPTLRRLLIGLIDLTDPARPPHPGGRPCGALCVPACTASAPATPTTAPTASTPTRGAQK